MLRPAAAFFLDPARQLFTLPTPTLEQMLEHDYFKLKHKLQKHLQIVSKTNLKYNICTFKKFLNILFEQILYFMSLFAISIIFDITAY